MLLNKHLSFVFNPAVKLDLGTTDKPNSRCSGTTRHKQQDVCTLSSLVESPERIHTVTSVPREFLQFPLFSIFVSGKLVTFLADIGQTSSSIRPQDLACSCKACRVRVASEGIQIDLNGQIIQHPFIVSSRRPLSTLGQDVLRQMKMQTYSKF